MSYIVPSQARALIDSLFPWAENEPLESGKEISLRPPDVHALLDLLDRIPDRLIRLSNDDFALYCANAAALRCAWENRQNGGGHIRMRPLSRADHSPVSEIRRLLAKCPDEGSAPAVVGLELIPDGLFREDLRADISSAESALMQHKYKAATVLGGAVVEALLLWALETYGEAKVRATAKASPAEPLNKWTLSQMIGAAHACGLIADDTRKQAELAQNFRNLIHPGRQARLQEKCDRGTALGALAAVERVAADLAKKLP
jgi:hypothetical protein